ncbi:MAG TPA: hypothetical protein VHP33_10295 [Polyangiaceae bacterium]|nr:hypothetical protein [Polyangiaceae bacterium]
MPDSQGEFYCYFFAFSPSYRYRARRAPLTHASPTLPAVDPHLLVW